MEQYRGGVYHSGCYRTLESSTMEDFIICREEACGARFAPNDEGALRAAIIWSTSGGMTSSFKDA